MALGVGTLLLQLRTVHDVRAKNDLWPEIESACRAAAQSVRATCRKSGDTGLEPVAASE